MRDVNTPLSKAYFTALTGITYNSIAVRSFSGEAPDDISDKNYIVFGEVSNNDLSSKSSADTSTSMRVTIHTFDEKYTSSIIANSIANQVLARIYPYTQFNLTLDGNFQIYSTELASDTTQSITMDANRAFIDRIFIFRHKIYHRA